MPPLSIAQPHQWLLSLGISAALAQDRVPLPNKVTACSIQTWTEVFANPPSSNQTAQASAPFCMVTALQGNHALPGSGAVLVSVVSDDSTRLIHTLCQRCRSPFYLGHHLHPRQGSEPSRQLGREQLWGSTAGRRVRDGSPLARPYSRCRTWGTCCWRVLRPSRKAEQSM